MTSKPNAVDVAQGRLLPNVAVMGKMGSGKTTIADQLHDTYGYEKLSFATALKNIAVDLWGTEALTDRGLMQVLGRKMREIDPMVWVNRALSELVHPEVGPARLLKDLHGGLLTPDAMQLRPVVIDDLRFPNEYHALKREDFVIIRVEAHRNQRVNRLKAIAKLQSEDQLLDESETALDGAVADHLLTNTTTPRELQDQLQGVIMREVRRRA